MNRRGKPTSLFLPLLIAAMVALVLLASLQYSWVGQVSAGERERRQANLAISVQRFREDFNRELSRAYLTFQMDAATLRDQLWSRYSRRYERWRDSAPYPDLVKAIYLVQVNQIGRVKLSRFNPEEGRFADEQWPYEMLPLRRSFERTYREIFAQGDRTRVNIEAVAPDGSALLVPVARPGLLSVQQDLGIDADLLFSDLIFPGTFNRCLRCLPAEYDTPLLAHTIVILDQDYIVDTMLPAMIDRYFPAGSGLDYHIGVVDRKSPDRLIFSSHPGLSAPSFAQGDASVGIFDITYEELNALLLTSDPRLEDDDAAASKDRLVIGVLGVSGEGETDPSQWSLVVKHREGSLDAAIGNLRLRNLLLSFGTLLILGVSVAMLMVSTRRAQRLAQQQIEFASAVSHELRTPLAVICSAGENLADGVVHDPQRARRYGAVIYTEGRRLTEMVEQVLAFAGAQSGRQRYSFQTTDIGDLLAGALHALQHQVREGGYQIELGIPADLPLIDADEIALRRSVQNLISNAMKYGGADRWIGVTAEVAAGELRISVSDHGAGVELADLPHIFEPFYRGRAAAAAQAHGSGLGLSLVRHAVEAHGGRVSVESQAGQGSRFTLHLPLPAPATIAAQPATL